MDNRHICDVLVIGAGPAGIAAAFSATAHVQRVILLDDNPVPGGQIWRGGGGPAAKWLSRLGSTQVITGARVIDGDHNRIAAETESAVHEFQYQKLILSTGARERFIPFPGWTLPGVMGAGGLQAFIKGGLSVQGKRVVVAGSGPLLLVVAASLRSHGAKVLLIAEQAPYSRLVRFTTRLIKQPAKLLQFAGLQSGLLGIPYHTGTWVTSATGEKQLQRVTVQKQARTWTIDCDYLAYGQYLVPNVELAVMLGCRLQDGAVRVGDFQETNLPNIYAAGELTGIGGVEKSLVEGQIAGYAAAGKLDLAHTLFPERARHHAFAQRLSETFALRPELNDTVTPTTLVCRCEDVSHERLCAQTSWRSAKLQTRCGMGPCQGRICGPAVSYLYGWQHDSVRPPVFPARIDSLTRIGTSDGETS